MASAARAAGARLVGPVGLPQLRDPEGDVRVLGRGLHGYAARSRRAPGPVTANTSSARPSTSGATGRGALGLHRLGHHQGRRLAQGERVEIRLRHVLPEGQDRASPATPTSRGTTATSAATRAEGDRASGLTLREYLWREQTAPAPTPTPTPDPSATPSAPPSSPPQRPAKRGAKRPTEQATPSSRAPPPAPPAAGTEDRAEQHA